VRFDKDGLVPLLIQDASSGAVLSLVYANEDSIRAMRSDGYLWRYSRRLGKVVRKGDQSGNLQKVVSLSLDCDGDALLAKVDPQGPMCHSGAYSCFGQEKGVLESLEDTIRERMGSMPKGSYTSRLLSDPDLLRSKLREELSELLDFKDKANLAWEGADLVYFMMVFLIRNGVSFKDVERELEMRKKRR
jgi:phosphoribosyl-ATP pyrophosphohydrolase